jgi:hypothetical protein
MDLLLFSSVISFKQYSSELKDGSKLEYGRIYLETTSSETTCVITMCYKNEHVIDYLSKFVKIIFDIVQ